ncbi:uncharacterized protein LOC122512116 [Leptopilina heterotoma]|uniref:uncharacterized protein LOC122512116 n=1 Tax=Leptopilina heterotoma TaxID=63436 RepID=UPI001CA9BAB2|nr:uncharacterized protein LOC122512116 [Leptopilina heterotoma]
MELKKFVIFLLLTLTIIYHSEGLSAGLKTNFDICGFKCGLGVNGAIPNACQFSRPPPQPPRPLLRPLSPPMQSRNLGGCSPCSSKMSQLSQKFNNFLRKKEMFLKQLFTKFQPRPTCQPSCPLLSVNLTPTIQKIRTPSKTTQLSCKCTSQKPQVRSRPSQPSCNCPRQNPQIRIAPRPTCDYTEECSENLDNNLRSVD